MIGVEGGRTPGARVAAGAATAAEAAPARSRGWALAWRRYPMAVAGAGLLVLLLLFALVGPMVWTVDPLVQSLVARNKAPGWIDAAGTVHLLGTDQVGRDVLARLYLGLRVSVLVGGLGTVGAAVLGVLAGAVAGYFAGKLDAAVMRVVDIQMSFPFILIAIIWALFFGSGLWSIIAIVAIRGWVMYARVIRSRILVVRELAFVEAARAGGASTARLLFRHVLPQTTASIIILSALQMGMGVILESTLGFLGLGIQPPTPTLGNMLADGQGYLQTAWWLVLWPGTLLALLVLGANTLGDGLRDVLDPQSQRRS